MPSSITPHDSASIAGSVLPIQRAEELIATLPGVISVRIIATPSGGVEEIHLLTTDAVAPKSTVRNVESALLAQLGMRVSHKKISVAITHTAGVRTPPIGAPVQEPKIVRAPQAAAAQNRRLYFEDIEVRRSRSKGVAVRVTLRKGDASFSGEVEGLETERMRMELAARAALLAMGQADGENNGVLGLEGCRMISAFDHEFVFVAITARHNRESRLLSGSAEVRESPEAASVLAVLDATNRWVDPTE